MKLFHILFLVLFLHNIVQAGFFDFWNELNNGSSPQLSELQNFQLAYLRDELAKNSKVVQTEWILNENVRTILEMIELCVQQSSAKTQELFEQEIIKVFQEFDINVYFTNDGLIEKIDTHNVSKIQHHGSKKLKFHHEKTYTSFKSRPPQKIKGANRTRKKLEEAWKRRKEAAQKEARDAQIKRDNLKNLEPSPADSMAQKIWEHEMERHMQTLSPEKENSHLLEFPENHGEI